MKAHLPEPWVIETHESDEGVDALYIVSHPMPEYENGDLRPVCLLTTEANRDELDDANAARIVACVNACAGMEDPAAEIARLREFVRLYKEEVRR